MDIKLLSVIIPIYKQEKTIQKDIENIYTTLKNTPYNFEIIGVVDGTNLDKSLENAQKVAKKHKNIKVYGYPTNKGKGQAVRYGMHKSKGDVVAFIDAGMDINPEGIVMLLEHMKWYDAQIITTSKLHHASKVHGYPLWRTKGYYYLVKLLFGLKIHDTQTGLKAYKRYVLDKVLDKLVVKKYAFDIEILAVANYLGFNKIYEAPVEIKYDADNSSLKISDLLKSKIIKDFILETFAIWYRLKILKYYKDGRKRVRVYDPELKMYVNTGDMTDKRQILIDLINNVI